MPKFKAGDTIYLKKDLYVLSPVVKVNDTFTIKDINDTLVHLKYLKTGADQYIKPSHFDYFELVTYNEKHCGDNE